MRMGMVVAAALAAASISANVMASDVTPVATCLSWDRTSTPNNGKANALLSVDALDAANVWAVGHDWNPVGTRQGAPLAVRRSGSTWIDEPLPDLSHLGNDPSLVAVHLAPSGDPWAVGRLSDAAGRGVPLLLRWSGGFWQAHHVVMIDSFAPRYGAFRDVTAIAESDAWAVGQAETMVKGAVEPFAAHWDGSAWSEAVLPAAPGRNRTLAAVSAAAPDAVWAVGYDFDADHTKTANARIFHWNGREWIVVDHPAANKPGAVLLDVVALAKDDIWAVGVIGDEEGGLFLHWDGSAWTTHAAPIGSNPRSVDGAASDDVWAVGAGGHSHWDGFRWTLVAAPETDRAHRRAAVTVAGPCEAWTVSTWGAGSTSASQVESLGPSAPAPTPPPTPVDFTVRPVSIKEIVLEWRSGADPTSAIGDTNYAIERCIGEAPDCLARFVVVAKANGKATSYVDAGLAPNTAYSYRIRATNRVGSSPATAPASAVTLSEEDPTPMPAPVPTRLSSSTGSDDAPPSAEAEPAMPATEAEPVEPSVAAAPLRFEPLPAPPPTPRNFTATGTGAKQITLSWLPGDGTGTVGGYGFVIERCVGEADACVTRMAVIAKVDGSASSFVDTGLAPKAAYTYRIRASGKAGQSAPTAPATAFTLAADSPSPLPVPAAPASSGPRS